VKQYGQKGIFTTTLREGKKRKKKGEGVGKRRAHGAKVPTKIRSGGKKKVPSRKMHFCSLWEVWKKAVLKKRRRIPSWENTKSQNSKQEGESLLSRDGIRPQRGRKRK